MSTKSKSSKLRKTLTSLNAITISFLLLAMMGLIWFAMYQSEKAVERAARSIEIDRSKDYNSAKTLAEIQKTLSETSGSLFWLKLVALFVTVGGAVGGYLMGQSQNSRRQIDFETRKNVDAAYQAIIQELADEKLPILRATAAVKLGTILEDFPHEWNVPEERQKQITRLTKQVLAAGLAIEQDRKVLKTLTINLVRHGLWESDPKLKWLDAGSEEWRKYTDASKLDLSEAEAKQAYWAQVDFTGTDFFKAKLVEASFRRSILNRTSFFYADLSRTVLAEARGNDTILAFADLRGANLRKAVLERPNFEGAKVNGAKLDGIEVTNPSGRVDISEAGDGLNLVPASKWLQDSGIVVKA